MTAHGLTPAQRFEQYVFIDEDEPLFRGEPCHWWVGAESGGYGKFFLGRNALGKTITVSAHRWINEQAYGPIPDDLEVEHACNHTLCVNPVHHDRVTQEVNKRLQGARQTHCLRGHKYTRSNTGRDGRGHRYCLRCQHERRLIGCLL